MVVSPPTYHIVQNVQPDRVQLGTIIDSLHEVWSLNESEELKLDHSRLYCEHETNVESTRAQMLKGSAGIGFKVMAVQAGEVVMGGERSLDDKFTYGTVDTLFFRSEPADYAEAVKSVGLQGFLEASDYAPVYLITGIKTGYNSTISLSSVKKIEGKIDIGIETGTGISLGSKFDPSKSTTLTQKADKAGLSVLAVRVRKLSYKKRWGIAGPREWKNEAHNAGAELVGKDRETKQKEEVLFEVEELELDTELDDYVKETEMSQDGEVITWVLPKV